MHHRLAHVEHLPLLQPEVERRQVLGLVADGWREQQDVRVVVELRRTGVQLRRERGDGRGGSGSGRTSTTKKPATELSTRSTSFSARSSAPLPDHMTKSVAQALGMRRKR